MKVSFIVMSIALLCASRLGMAADTHAEATDQMSHSMTAHKHGPNCGHKTVEHDGHIDYVHDGVYHAAHKDHFDNHGMSSALLEKFDKGDRSVASVAHKTFDEKGHVHGPNCGHKSVHHGDHVDYVHDGHYHAAHGDHSDDHGAILPK